MNTLSKLLMSSAALGILVSGCASKPKPVTPVTATAPDAAPTAAPPPPPSSAATLPPISRPTAPTTPAQTGPVPGSLADFQQSVGDRIYFQTDRWDISAEAKASLDRQAKWLNTYRGITLMVSGNCDERGTREYNLALGSRRAESVKNYLVSLGVDPGRISTVSYGKERPIDPRPSEEGWAVNRNAQTQLTGGMPGV